MSIFQIIKQSETVGLSNKPHFGGIVSGIIGAAGSLIGGRQQNSSARSAAREANAWTNEQLQSRHQWEVEDLRKAGLNPILSAHGTPSIGGSAQADVPSNSLGEAASSALAVRKLDAELDNLRADTNLKKDSSKTAQAAALSHLATAGLSNSAADLNRTANIQKSALSPVYEVGGKLVKDTANIFTKRINEVKSLPQILKNSPGIQKWRNIFSGSSAKASH